MKNYMLSLTAAAFAGTASAHAVDIVGHRGASYDAPENTLSSFKLGYAQGADADECDIYLTKDEKIVIIHDPTTTRTGGVTNRVAKSTVATLRRMDVGKFGKWKDGGYSEKIPLLEEALALIPDGKKFFIEIKCGPEILPELKRVLAASGKKPEQTVLIGFGYDTMREAKKALPNLTALWLASADKQKKFPPVDDLIQKATAAKLDGLDLEQGFAIDAAFVQKVHKAGLKLYTWTVDDPEVARKEVAAGVDGITTNRPQWLREQLQQVQ